MAYFKVLSYPGLITNDYGMIHIAVDIGHGFACICNRIDGIIAFGTTAEKDE
jgi:hypothetical protein